MCKANTTQQHRPTTAALKAHRKEAVPKAVNMLIHHSNYKHNDYYPAQLHRDEEPPQTNHDHKDNRHLPTTTNIYRTATQLPTTSHLTINIDSTDTPAALKARRKVAVRNAGPGPDPARITTRPRLRK